MYPFTKLTFIVSLACFEVGLGGPVCWPRGDRANTGRNDKTNAPIWAEEFNGSCESVILVEAEEYVSAVTKYKPDIQKEFW